MEGSEGEAVFDSLNLKPQLFVNETLNTVDDLVDDAFNFYHQEASALLKIEGTDRSQDLTEGVTYIRNMIQSVLDKRLGMWEQYCLRHCFAVPEGFSLLKSNELPDDGSTCQDAICDPDLDAQLALLREKLTLAGKKSAELNSELQELERQSVVSNLSTGLVNKALQFYEQNSVNDMFQEMTKTASELREKMEKLKSRRWDDIERARMERIYNADRDTFLKHHDKGLSNFKLEDLQKFLVELKKV